MVITRAIHGQSRPRPMPDYVTPTEQEIRTKFNKSTEELKAAEFANLSMSTSCLCSHWGLV